MTYGKGITDDNLFIKRAVSCIGDFMRDDENGFKFERLIAPQTGRILFSKSLNRSVTGSINDLVFQAKVRMIEGEKSPYDVSFGLNEIPMSYLDYDRPKKAFNALEI